MRYVLMHISDLHAGPPFNPLLADHLARQAHEIQPDLLVISGDFVQRADFPHQWQVITAFLRKLPTPQLTVPGNHDVALYNVFNRFFRPMKHFRRHISNEINQVFERPGLFVAGGNSAHGATIDGGFVNAEQMAHMEDLFSQAPAGACKVAVLHHHVINPPGSRRTKISNADAVVRMLDGSGVDLLLCGHIHVSYVGTTMDVLPDLRQGTIICQSGTTTSRRGKSRERGKNSYNLIEIDDHVIRIGQHLYLEDAGHFVPVAEHIFPRRSAGTYLLPPAERVVQADSQAE